MGFAKRVPPQGDTIAGKFVPGGTDIMTNMFAMLRNRDVFGEDADVFRPERFLESSSSSDGDNRKRMQLQHKVIDLSFGHGRWGCPGKMLAWMELNKTFVEVRFFSSLSHSLSLSSFLFFCSSQWSFSLVSFPQFS
jgi:cytochrome P450